MSEKSRNLVSEKQWFGIAGLGGIVAGLSIYALQGRIGFYAFIVLATALAGWMAFRRPDGARRLMGLVIYLVAMALTMPLGGIVLEGNVANVWGVAVVAGSVPAALFYYAVNRFIRK